MRVVWQRRIKPVLAVALGPARHANKVIAVWPVAITFAAFVAAIFGASLPKHVLRFERPWLLALAAALFAVLFLRAAFAFQGKGLATFPRSEIEVEPQFYVQHESDDDDTKLIRTALIFAARVTNRDPSRRMNLTFDLAHAWGPPKGTSRDFRLRLFPTREATRRKYEAELLPSILKLDPHDTASGYLSFDWDHTREGDSFITFEEDGVGFAAGLNGRFVMTVHDYVSGVSVELDVPGTLAA